jgi:hypothetical protein
VSTNIDVVQEHDDIIYPQVVLFLLIHVGCVAAIWSGVTWQAIAICMGSLLVAHVRDRRWVSSLLLAPSLLD